jgi:hypothetical protein
MGMGNTDGGDGIDARRRLVERLRAHEDVRRVDFSRDGFRVVVVELEPGAGFRDRWRETATELGYTVERLAPGEAPSDRPTEAWVLRLEDATAGAGESTGGSALRRVVARVRAFLDRLLGRRRR